MFKRMQQKMRQSFYSPKKGKVSILETLDVIDSMEKSLEDSIKKITSMGKKKSKDSEKEEAKG